MLLLCPAFLLFIFSSGCGGGRGGSAGAASVTGKVTYKGSALTGGKLLLHSQGAPGSFSMEIRPDGSFFNGDIPKDLIGMVTITVETKHLKDLPAGDPTDPGVLKQASKGKIDPSALKGPKMSGPGLTAMEKASQTARAAYVEIPEKYGDPKQSGLTWEIKAGKNERTFDLN
jgi:hypothetical protein